MSASDANLAGTYLGNRRYRVEYRLGQGGMGAVWLATDENLGERVALKLLPDEIQFDPVALDDMRRETARSRRLAHPNIVRIHDLHEFPNEPPFISMEYIDGAALNRFKTLQQSRCLPWDFVASLLGQLCAALDYAHGENLIHRDLKPGNLMLDTRCRLKLADFGISAVVSDSMSRVSLQGNTSGTPAYMSPQQMDGCTPRVTDDIYALGATLYDLLTGKPPFFRGDILHQVRGLEPPTIEERLDEFGLKNALPPEVGAMIMACLAKDPEKRPQSAAAVAEWIGLGTLSEPAYGTLARQVFAEITPDTPSSRDLTVLTSDDPEPAPIAETLVTEDIRTSTSEAPSTDGTPARRRMPGLLIGTTLLALVGLILFATARKKNAGGSSKRQSNTANLELEVPFAGPWLTEPAQSLEHERWAGMFRLHEDDHLRNCTVVTLERKRPDARVRRRVEPWRQKNRIWSIEDGIIRAQLVTDEQRMLKSYLVFNGLDLGSFVLNFAFRETRKTAAEGNFGLFYRSRNLNEWWLDGPAIVLGDASGQLWGIPPDAYTQEERKMSQTGLKRPLREFLSAANRSRLRRENGHLGTLRVAEDAFIHIIDQERGRHFQFNNPPPPIPAGGTIALEAWIEGPGEMLVEFEGLSYRPGPGPRGMF